MIDLEFIKTLPDDPDEAFPLYEAHVRSITVDKSTQNTGSVYERDYVLYILAFLHHYNIGLELSEPPASDDDFWDYYRTTLQSIKYHIMRRALSRKTEQREDENSLLVISPSLKLEIHHYIEKIRELLTSADCNPDKKEALFKLLNKFALEVDKDRTGLQALAAFYLRIRPYVKEDVTWAVEIGEKLSKIWDKLTKASDYLPSPNGPREIEAPKKRIEGPPSSESRTEADDEVPF